MTAAPAWLLQSITLEHKHHLEGPLFVVQMLYHLLLITRVPNLINNLLLISQPDEC